MKVCVIGGGASGMISSIFLAREGIDVILLEKNEKLGKKLYITGKGRCNVTNACSTQEFFTQVVHGEKFLRSALYGFTPADAMDFFEGIGLKLVVERGNRVFPLSQKSSDVIKVLEHEMKRQGVDIRLNCEVKAIKRNGERFSVVCNREKIDCDIVVVATGGISYPSTGSTGDGYIFAKSFGHKIVEPRQALVPLILKQDVSSLQGISLKNVNLTAFDSNGKTISSEFGEMLFTRNGVSGPIVLTTSSLVNRYSGIRLSLDLKPAIDEKTLDLRLLREFESRKNQDVKNVTRAILPDRLNVFVLKRASIDLGKKVNSITKEERAILVAMVKNLEFDVKGLAPFTEAVVTSGGVELKDLKPTCESKLTKGLYFVGETIDVDAMTGGFNLQIAYATAVIAARDIIKHNQALQVEAL